MRNQALLILFTLIGVGCSPRYATLEEVGGSRSFYRVPDGPLVETLTLRVVDVRPSLPEDRDGLALTVRNTGDPTEDRAFRWTRPARDMIEDHFRDDLAMSGIAKTVSAVPVGRALTPTPSAEVLVTVLEFHGHYDSNNADGMNSLSDSTNAFSGSRYSTSKRHQGTQYGKAVLDVAVLVNGRQVARQEIRGDSFDENASPHENAARALRGALGRAMMAIDEGVRKPASVPAQK